VCAREKEPHCVNRIPGIVGVVNMRWNFLCGNDCMKDYIMVSGIDNYIVSNETSGADRKKGNQDEAACLS